MFEKATRNKFRFDSAQGKLTVEDLWELPLTSNSANKANLDDIARNISRQIRSEDTEESFVHATKSTTSDLKVKLEILKHIISVKMADAETVNKARDTRAKKQQILQLLEQKQNEALSNKSAEELTALLESL